MAGAAGAPQSPLASGLRPRQQTSAYTCKWLKKSLMVKGATCANTYAVQCCGGPGAREGRAREGGGGAHPRVRAAGAPAGGACKRLERGVVRPCVCARPGKLQWAARTRLACPGSLWQRSQRNLVRLQCLVSARNVRLPLSFGSRMMRRECDPAGLLMCAQPHSTSVSLVQHVPCRHAAASRVLI